MSVIVPTQQQAIDNIPRFADELDTSAELQRRLAFARAWYAVQDEEGDWHFAPSKFCGYEGMTAEEYTNDDPRDGRRTEAQLQKWFTVVPEEDPLFDTLYEALTSFLATYDKPPSSAIRINVTKEHFAEHIGGGSAKHDARVADLILAVCRGLPDKERQRIKAGLYSAL